ncbi:putative NAD-dependent deacetylase sirtuin-5 [Glarea lozoyensis 74030]|uniref:Putative NAD-dependent deacetylase sirtuin-5 n=1 Tax=Glarea lozoyensis (strain ATCC 74030 / MF5533) TaxID=1104152 RepID=H0EKS4_GLAL7|nr:putative NAD-dependent deacetylase sirtuin-5 [Glarea lozoyensis 74030]
MIRGWFKWLFYALRRHQALNAKPNMAHFALAELARQKGEEGFQCLSQNVDGTPPTLLSPPHTNPLGLSQRASHPPSQLKLLHSTLFNLKCFNDSCTYLDIDNFTDPLCPALTITPENIETRLAPAAKSMHNHLDPRRPKAIPEDELPHCPSCETGLLRPGVVWFGEALPSETIEGIDEWIEAGESVDLILVIGTTATVWPASSYVEIARRFGAKVAVVNMDDGELGSASDLREGDFWFQGDAAVLVPQMLEPVVGDLKQFKELAA